MSAPALIACGAAALFLGLPVIAASAQLEAGASAAGTADAAALAAADALTGWIPGEPCEIARSVARANRAEVTSCDAVPQLAVAVVEVRVESPLGGASGSARAGLAFLPQGGPNRLIGEVAPNGWAWPSDRRGVTQGFHDGYAIDLEVSEAGALYAPYDGRVVRVGSDGGGIPEACASRPDWWRGPNYTVLIRHTFQGRTIYSSHNHVEPGSSQRLGVGPGTPVRAGQQVAVAGMSGCTSGQHTHFTLSSSAANVQPDLDPFEYLGGPEEVREQARTDLENTVR